MVVHRMMPPKMLTSTALTFLSPKQDAKGLGDLLDVRAAAHVQKVRRLAAVQLDQVHGAHGQAGSVDQAADVAVQLDVAQAGLAGAGLRPALPRPSLAT